MKWYMTVGYAGGEYAAQDSVLLSTERLEPPLAYDADVIEGMDREQDGSIEHGWFIRPCPPDLVEWIDGRQEQDKFAPYWMPREGGRFYPVAGGWMVLNFDPGAAVFIPVQGAAGLTVLEAPHD